MTEDGSTAGRAPRPVPLDEATRRTRMRGSNARALRRDHPTATAFLDETGAIANDRIFGVGLLKLTEPARVLRRIQKLRDRHHWYKEIKFGAVTSGSLALYKEVVDACMDEAEFFCFVADRQKADPIERFGTSWDAYGKLAEQLTVAALHPDELVSIMADNYSTPDHVLFEENLRSSVNRRLERLAVVSVVRQDSRSSDGLQIADMLTSGAAFEFRAEVGLASTKKEKAQLAAHVRGALGATSCLAGWRSGSHSVQIYEHGAWSQPHKK